ncbi:MAG: 4Fe-4S dicluster domain-containing protein [Thermoplasmata archaeon]
MTKILVPYPEKCTGCRFCEIICTLENDGVINSKKARLRIEKRGIRNDIPVVCTQCIACEENCCTNVCPVEAIYMENGVVRIDKDKCTSCGTCVETCPYGVIKIVDNCAVKCELCGGSPQCAKHCIIGALKFEEPVKERYLNVKKMIGVG